MELNTNPQILTLGQQIYDLTGAESKTVLGVIREDGQIKLVFSDDSEFIVTGLARQKLDDWLGD